MLVRLPRVPPTNPPDPHDDLEELRGPASDPILSGSLKAQPGFTRKLALALVVLLVLFAMVGGPLAIVISATAIEPIGAP